VVQQVQRMNKAVFLDRDGTINEDVGDFCSQEKLVFIPGAIEGLKILQDTFLLFIITNQSGIGKNIFTEEEFISLRVNTPPLAANASSGFGL
jgi:histidinol phosphatase-like enzyme